MKSEWSRLRSLHAQVDNDLQDVVDALTGPGHPDAVRRRARDAVKTLKVVTMLLKSLSEGR